MKIEMRAISDIQEYENNPRKNDNAINAVAKSIEQYGFLQPCVIDRNGILVAGHTRFKAAKQLNLKTIPCVNASNLTDEQVKQFRILDNKLNELAEWDFPKLEEELLELKDFDFSAFDIDFGFLTNTDDLATPKELNESAADKVKFVECPECGHKFPS